METTIGGLTWWLAGAIVAFVSTQWAWHICLTQIRISRLRTALAIDCLATLNKFGSLYSEFGNYSKKCTKDMLFEVPSNFIVSAPLNEPRELIALVNKEEAILIIHYYDRWARLVAFEQRFAVVFEKAITILAGKDHDVNSKLIDEFLEQLSGILELMEEAAAELCYLSCKLYRKYSCSDEFLLADHSGSRWNKWADWTNELKRHEDCMEAVCKRLGRDGE